MKILLISQDVYFTHGVLNIFQTAEYCCESMSSDNFSCSDLYTLSNEYDLIILDAVNFTKSNVKFNFNHPLHNVIVAIDISPSLLRDKRNFISKKDPIHVIQSKVQQYLSLVHEDVKYKEFKALQFTAAGKNIPVIASMLNTTEKNIYQLRNHLVYKCGFLRYHPFTAIYCKKILPFISRQSPTDLLYYNMERGHHKKAITPEMTTSQ
ncbi:TPA: hypothetical protein I8190_003705 [Citrobacter freundii]|uniref:hypothetical protein n=1 Tax=Citrobacter farmeri TaxID=67824 RepID=UPI000F677D7B|nr:hypothetical protein [Citrobacter farmeri]HAT2286722.1 hypothetical protein [Citrobacter freundii]EKV7297270.1 hypothetical protein [Citrobacter farmeri]EKW5934987.1 hypothetical protein [Citrobacter farmeri]ELR9635984.1 hypothetical protein [Citrobacter farmeri]MBJ8745385.1 hypothetical protein [Citrobacter farmeri]